MIGSLWAAWKDLKMNKDIKKQWTDALRYGGYTQGHNKLRDCDSSFCCLGVLCDVIDHDAWKIHNSAQFYTFRGSYLTIPVSTMDEAKLTHSICQELIYLNDDDGCGFTAIADWIERNVAEDE